MINIIAAVAKNCVIGMDGGIPWDIPEDRQTFRELTLGSVLIMGRKTYQSIGRPLEGRKTIVITSNGIPVPDKYSDVLFCAPDFQSGLDMAKKNGREIFICGGESIYREGLSVADRLYITLVECEADGDTYFPANYAAGYRLIARKRLNAICTQMIYERT